MRYAPIWLVVLAVIAGCQKPARQRSQSGDDGDDARAADRSGPEGRQSPGDRADDDNDDGQVPLGPVDYVGAVVSAKSYAQAKADIAHMKQVHRALKMHATVGGSFPPSLEAIGDQGMLKAPSGQAYAYVPGRSPDGDPDAVLLYVPEPAYGGKYREKLLAVTVGGDLAAMEPEALRARLDEAASTDGQSR